MELVVAVVEDEGTDDVEVVFSFPANVFIIIIISIIARTIKIAV